MQHTYTANESMQKRIRDDMPIAILPPVDKPLLPQNRGQSGKEGTPHKPLLPERSIAPPWTPIE